MADSKELSFRRLVTGNDADGKSYLVDDRRIVEGGAGNFDHWITQAGDSRSEAEALSQTQPFFPGDRQAFFRFFRIPAGDPNMPVAELDRIAQQMFESFGIADCRIDTSRHPMMHRTPSVDYIVLLSGAVSLLLDEGDPIPLKPFDVVVQRKTNHAWINTGAEDAVLVAVMLGDL